MKDRGVEGDENKAPMCSTAEVGVGGREEDISNGGWDTREVLVVVGGVSSLNQFLTVNIFQPVQKPPQTLKEWSVHQFSQNVRDV